MSDHDQEVPFDRERLQSSLEQPSEMPAKSVSDPAEVRKTDVGTGEQDMSQVPTRWQRIKEHAAFKPVLVVGGLAAVVGVALLTPRSPEALKQVSAAVWEKVPEITEAAFGGIGEEAIRKSPTEHKVNGHTRSQHYGPGRTETKIIQVAPYSRGAST